MVCGIFQQYWTIFLLKCKFLVCAGWPHSWKLSHIGRKQRFSLFPLTTQTPCTMANRKGCKTDLCIFLSPDPLLFLHFSLLFDIWAEQFPALGPRSLWQLQDFLPKHRGDSWDPHVPTCCIVQWLGRSSSKALGAAWEMAKSHFLLKYY